METIYSIQIYKQNSFNHRIDLFLKLNVTYLYLKNSTYYTNRMNIQTNEQIPMTKEPSLHTTRETLNPEQADFDQEKENVFATLDLPVPPIVKTYSLHQQQLICEYLKEFNDFERKAYLLAYDHLKTSFSIDRSNGFKKWLTQHSYTF